MKNHLKNVRGITLIALVVTIIVLLILTGVALRLVMGDNGLLHRTETAVDTHQEKAASEKLNMIITACQIEYYSEKAEMPGISYLAAYLQKDADNPKGDIEYVNQKSDESASLALLDDSGYADWTGIITKLKAYPYVFEINDKLQLAKIDGVQVADSGSTSGGLTQEDVQTMITTALASYVKKEDLTDFVTESDINSTYATKVEVQQASQSSAGNPVGTIIAYSANSVPTGYLKCEGQAVSRTEYSALFDLIGTTYGSGNGSTTFNVPDLRGEFLRGAGTNSHTNQGSGGTVGQHQDATKQFNIVFGGNNLNYSKYSGASWVNQDVDSSGPTNYEYAYYGVGSNSGWSNYLYYTARPTNTSVLYCIKAK